MNPASFKRTDKEFGEPVVVIRHLSKRKNYEISYDPG